MRFIRPTTRQTIFAWLLFVGLVYPPTLIDCGQDPPKYGSVNLFIEPSAACQAVDELQDFYHSKANSSSIRDLYRCVKPLDRPERRKVLVTGGAGFVGSHLVDNLMLDGHEVIVLDNFFTGRRQNIEHWLEHPNFKLLEHDVIEPMDVKIDQIYHLASPASPAHYLNHPIETIKTNTIGTINLLDLAAKHNARMVYASTSEIYGDPEVHPQSESYWGNTNPVGPRSCYDEGKRLGESLSVAYRSKKNVSIGIARIFNTYGPRMHVNDGRVVSNFISQALQDEPITIYGNGLQTRSFQYVKDLVRGLRKLMASDGVFGPINLGNPEEMTIMSLAQRIKADIPTSKSELVFKTLPIDDPRRRRPDIRRALDLLSWKPLVSLDTGLARTVDYFKQEFHVNLNGSKSLNLVVMTEHIFWRIKNLGFAFKLHNKWFARTILVNEGQLPEAYRTFNKMLAYDDIFGKHRRTRYCEKPFNYRRRKSYEVCKAIYDEDMSRKIKFVLRQDREDPWIGS